MSDYVLFQTAADSNEFVPLSRTRKGRLFRKQILKVGESFVHPASPTKRIEVTAALANSLVENFKNGTCDIVQVPLVNDTNAHVEDPTRNIGEVVDLSADDKGVYATIDVRKHADDVGSTILGASALMHLDYTDTKSGARKGPTLLHVAMTNRPYLTNLEDFEEIAALSADTHNEKPEIFVSASHTEDKAMGLDEMISALKNDHNIDVRALQDRATDTGADLVAAMSNVLAEAGASTDGDNVTVSDVANAVIELAEEKVALSNTLAEQTKTLESLMQERAESEVDGLIEEGRILPAQREVMVRLSRNDRETFDAIVPDSAIVGLSAQGVDSFDAPKSEKLDAEIERLSNLAKTVK